MNKYYQDISWTQLSNNVNTTNAFELDVAQTETTPSKEPIAQ